MADIKFQRSWLPWIAVCATALVLAERLFLLVERYAVNIFFSDQWEFNDATLFQSHSWWGIFTWQHGPHRQGLGGLLSELINPRLGWDSRTESYAVAGILVAAALLAIWLKWRLFGEMNYYDVVVPSLVLTATQCEVIFGAANLAHGSVPLLLIILYGLAWTIRRTALRFVGVLLVNFLLIFTGFGLLMGVITPLAIGSHFWMQKQKGGQKSTSVHIAAMAVALLSLGIFFVHYTWNPAVTCYDSVLVSRTPVDYLHFVALMLANYVGFDGTSSKHPAAWGVLLLVLLTIALAAAAMSVLRSGKGDERDNTARIVSFAFLAFSVVFCIATANGRLCLGFAAAQESRYMPYITPAFLGAYFLLTSALNPWQGGAWVRHLTLISFLGVALYASWPVHIGDQLEMTGFQSAKIRWKGCYLLNHDIALCNKQTGVRICNPPEAPRLQEKLNFLEREHLNLFNGKGD
jgi:hypothetical protein